MCIVLIISLPYSTCTNPKYLADKTHNHLWQKLVFLQSNYHKYNEQAVRRRQESKFEHSNTGHRQVGAREC